MFASAMALRNRVRRASYSLFSKATSEGNCATRASSSATNLPIPSGYPSASSGVAPAGWRVRSVMSSFSLSSMVGPRRRRARP